MNVRTAFVRRQLATGVALLGSSLASTASADVQNITGFGVGAGPNGRVLSGYLQAYDFLAGIGGAFLGIANNYQSGPNVMSGLVSGSSQVEIAAMNATVASPQIFRAGDTIAGPAAGVWAAGIGATSSLFGFNTTTAANLGPGSFMAFRVWNAAFTQARYGYFEVTWNSLFWEFEILSGAYEDNFDTAITIPAGGGGGGGVPLPGAAGLAACGLLGLSRRRRR